MLVGTNWGELIYSSLFLGHIVALLCKFIAVTRARNTDDIRKTLLWKLRTFATCTSH